jgi:hypothetical protein
MWTAAWAKRRNPKKPKLFQYSMAEKGAAMIREDRRA